MPSQETTNALAVVGVIFLLVCLYLYATKTDHQGRNEFPCYCHACETKLINEAKKGDPKAIKKLHVAIENGVYRDETLSSTLGPFASILGFFIVGVIVVLATSILGFIGQKTGTTQALQSGSRFVEQGISAVGQVGVGTPAASPAGGAVAAAPA